MAHYCRWLLLSLSAAAPIILGTNGAALAGQHSPYRVIESVVSSGPLIQSNPRVSGKWVVWREATPNQDSRLAGRNLETGLAFVVSTAASPVWPGDLGGDIVVAAEVGFDQTARTPLYGIFGYRLPDAQRFVIAPFEAAAGGAPLYRSYPRTDGKTVVWLETEGERHDIYGYDLSTQRSFTVSAGPGFKEWPSVSAQLVAWRDRRHASTPTAADIYAFDLATGREFRVSAATEVISPAAAHAGRIVWFATRGDGIHLLEYDHSTRRVAVLLAPIVRPIPLLVRPHIASGPEFDGNLVVWSAYGEQSADVFGFDRQQGRSFVISRAIGEQLWPAISGSIVVWEDRRNSGVGKYEQDADIFAATLDPGPAAPPQARGAPEDVDVKIEIVWPHGGVPVAEADRANIGAWLFLAGGSRFAPCQWSPRVVLWRALNNEPAQKATIAQKEGDRHYVNGRGVPTYEFNNVDVSTARDPANKIYFFVNVDGVPARYNVWSHAADARTSFPAQDVPSGVGQVYDAVDAKIEIVWPHDNAPVDQARQVNVSATLFASGTTLSIPADWSGAVRLYGALNNDVGREIAVGVKRLVGSDGAAYPVWDFNNVDVTAATDPANNYFFTLGVDGVETRTNVWTHGAGGRTIFPQVDTPVGDCRLTS